MDTFSQIKSFVEPIKRRILLMFARAVIKAVQDSEGIQIVQIEAMQDEVRDGVERFQDYGFTSNPPLDSEAIICFIGGNRAHGIALKVDNRTARKKDLEPGESAQYNDKGDYILLSTDREMKARANKFQFQGASDELIDLIAQLAEACEVAQTAVGPLLNQSTFTLIKTKLEALKV